MQSFQEGSVHAEQPESNRAGKSVRARIDSNQDRCYLQIWIAKSPAMFPLSVGARRSLKAFDELLCTEQNMTVVTNARNSKD